MTVRSGDLNPGSGDFAVSIRFRTTQRGLGNFVQKGQATNPGGFWKVESNRGQVECVFRGTAARGRVLSNRVTSGSKRLNDGAWHTVKCERSRKRLTMTIDGKRVRHSAGRTGTIANTEPLSIGGKTNCNQVEVSCDYFFGRMDSLRVYK